MTGGDGHQVAIHIRTDLSQCLGESRNMYARSFQGKGRRWLGSRGC
jgi:hypothetical protein